MESVICTNMVKITQKTEWLRPLALRARCETGRRSAPSCGTAQAEDGLRCEIARRLAARQKSKILLLIS